MKRVLIISGLLISALSVKAEYQNHTTEDYIELWKNSAIEQMHQFKIPASITLAQGILESGNGNSKLARHANNHFGIKCHENWEGGTFYQDDDEANECFRSYTNASESYVDHSLFLKNRPRYSNLFTLSMTDYKGWAHGLKSAGYATNPKYASLLIDLIEKYNLAQFDLVPMPEKQEDFLIVNSNPVTNITELESPQTAGEIDLTEIKHHVYENKKAVHFVVVQKGDTFYRIAEEFNLGMWQLYKYNELGKRDVLKEGEIIYISPKSNKSTKGYNVHVCEKDMTLRDVSQAEGVKLNKLMDYNDIINPDEVLPKGTKVILR
ncbi:MAG: glucosaminidase domain-containing protein, partial [Crocinitomicaceae bacterium]|nr:glucosaminidase domain-containing protein [Crocinitomicaceae bacterium]